MGDAVNIYCSDCNVWGEMMANSLGGMERSGAEIGEIVARGNVVMAGYYKQPEETAKAMRNGWFHTGYLAL